MSVEKLAPGGPGIAPRWTSSAKSGIGKALNSASEVSFTISHGIINEVYYPREDVACTRDMGLLVTNGSDFFSEEKRNTDHTTETMDEGIPAFLITNICQQKKYVIEKEIITDPLRDTLLQRIKFRTLQGKSGDYHLYALLAPHLGNSGRNNTAWLGDYKGKPMLFAERAGTTLAMACSIPWKKKSVGFAGVSDGCQDLDQHKEMRWEYGKAENGNVVLMAEIDLQKSESEIVIAISFGKTFDEAGNRASASLLDGFDFAKKQYIKEWSDWQDSLCNLKSVKKSTGKHFRKSASILRMNEAKSFPGGIIASMSIPWGFSKGDNDIGGYHLVWPRDLVESSGGFIALNAKEDAIRILNYLMSTQEADGKWGQNMWLEGKPYWNGIQMDQTALPILLIDLCIREKILKPWRMKRYWPMVKKAASFLVCNGPFTQQDRWEEQAGYTPFTLAAQIAALLIVAELAKENKENEIAEYCYQTADNWNESIEKWCYVKDTELAKEIGVEGYYIRNNPEGIDSSELRDRYMNTGQYAGKERTVLVNEMVCVDALALVRFGLRAADDPRILNTLKVIDAKLKKNTPNGPCWYRYNYDGYGEHEDGSPYDGSGIGRPWPLLTGERAHYEIAAGNFSEAEVLLKAMDAFSNNGLLPEQIWDAADIPESELLFGEHTGSAMPLTWAHAEYIKLCCSLKQKKIFDMPQQTQKRYIKNQTKSDVTVWKFDDQIHSIPKEKKLRIEVKAAATINFSFDNWQTKDEIKTSDTGLGMHIADISIETGAHEISFTFYWSEAQKPEGSDFKIAIS